MDVRHHCVFYAWQDQILCTVASLQENMDSTTERCSWNAGVHAQMRYDILYNLYKDSCPLIGWFAFIILTIYRIRWQNILLHSVWVDKSAKIIYYCTHRLLLY